MYISINLSPVYEKIKYLSPNVECSLVLDQPYIDDDIGCQTVHYDTRNFELSIACKLAFFVGLSRRESQKCSGLLQEGQRDFSGVSSSKRISEGCMEFQRGIQGRYRAGLIGFREDPGVFKGWPEVPIRFQ